MGYQYKGDVRCTDELTRFCVALTQGGKGPDRSKVFGTLMFSHTPFDAGLPNLAQRLSWDSCKFIATLPSLSII